MWFDLILWFIWRDSIREVWYLGIPWERTFVRMVVGMMSCWRPSTLGTRRGLGHWWRYYVCRKHWHCVSWRMPLYMWGAMHIRMQMRTRVAEVDTAVYLILASAWLEVEKDLYPCTAKRRDVLIWDLNVIWSEGRKGVSMIERKKFLKDWAKKYFEVKEFKRSDS